MDGQSPKGSRQMRARSVYPTSAGDRSFRIENGAGQLLRTIQGARHAEEALALYWRHLGAGLPGAMMGNDLDRRIRRMQAARNSVPAPELPFDAAPESSGAAAAGPKKRSRPTRTASGSVPQTDLFEDAPDKSATDLLPEQPTADVPVAETVSAGPPQADDRADELPADERLADEPSADEPPADEPSAGQSSLRPPEPELRVLDPAAVMLQRVDPRNLRPTDRADSYLYHVTNGSDAELALKQGLGVSASDPVILTERQGVAYWLSVLAEDYDYILDGPPDFVVLRLRRIAVEQLLDHDPAASRSAGCPCFLLTGGGAPRERTGG